MYFVDLDPSVNAFMANGKISLVTLNASQFSLQQINKELTGY